MYAYTRYQIRGKLTWHQGHTLITSRISFLCHLAFLELLKLIRHPCIPFLFWNWSALEMILINKFSLKLWRPGSYIHFWWPHWIDQMQMQIQIWSPEISTRTISSSSWAKSKPLQIQETSNSGNPSWSQIFWPYHCFCNGRAGNVLLAQGCEQVKQENLFGLNLLDFMRQDSVNYNGIAHSCCVSYVFLCTICAAHW